MNSFRLIVRRRPLLFFFIIAYSFTWIGWLLPDRIYNGTLLTTLLALPFFLMMAGPLLAALIITKITAGRAGTMTLLSTLTQSRVNWKWYLLALLLGPAIGLTATYFNVWFGAPDPTLALLSSIPNILSIFCIRLINPFDGPMQEELGWRGFALPRLQERHSILTSNLILGVLVAGWHIPLCLTGKLPLFALLGTVAATIVFGWIFNNTNGSVLLTLITHSADGLIKADFTGTDLTRFYVFYVAIWCVAGLFTLTHIARNHGKETSISKK